MKTFTAQELADFYQKVADGKQVQYRPYTKAPWRSQETPNGPSLKCRDDNWRIKPTKKVIDLSVLIESGIDCEFTDNCWQVYSSIDILTDIECNAVHPYTTNDVDLSYNKCQPRMNHKHAWLHRNCPIEGFVVRAWFDKEDFTTVDTSFNIINWNNVIWVEFLELEDGYVMPWELIDEQV